jgi:hypothetical protein
MIALVDIIDIFDDFPTQFLQVTEVFVREDGVERGFQRGEML